MVTWLQSYLDLSPNRATRIADGVLVDGVSHEPNFEKVIKYHVVVYRHEFIIMGSFGFLYYNDHQNVIHKHMLRNTSRSRTRRWVYAWTLGRRRCRQCRDEEVEVEEGKEGEEEEEEEGEEEEKEESGPRINARAVLRFGGRAEGGRVDARMGRVDARRGRVAGAGAEPSITPPVTTRVSPSWYLYRHTSEWELPAERGASSARRRRRRRCWGVGGLVGGWEEAEETEVMEDTSERWDVDEVVDSESESESGSDEVVRVLIVVDVVHRMLEVQLELQKPRQLNGARNDEMGMHVGIRTPRRFRYRNGGCVPWFEEESGDG
ncbi:hypothetical protein EV368DRAFT_68999 [Lentinula lateritia]|nr:hypothetical protein EV368DRAFT_68999 [Lentinula lateritia]